MFVSNSHFLELRFVMFFVNLLENIFETSVISFQNRIFRRKIQRPLFGQSHLERGMRKSVNRLVGIVHRHCHTISLEIINFPSLWLSSTFWRKSHSEFTFSFDYRIGCFVLVTESMTPDYNRLCPTLNVTRYVFHDNGLTENSTSHDVSDGSVWRFPHFFQSELLYSGFVRCDGRTFDSDIVFFDG